MKKTVILFKNTSVFYKTTNSGEVLRKWKRNMKCIINFCIINFLPKRRHVLSNCRKYCVANIASRDKCVKGKKWLASVFVVGWAELCVSVSEHFHMLYFTCELFMPSKMAKLNLQNLNKMTKYVLYFCNYRLSVNQWIKDTFKSFTNNPCSPELKHFKLCYSLHTKWHEFLSVDYAG